MITLVQGDLLKADVEALVNAVNCVGVMGKGIALQFKEQYYNNFKLYEDACKVKLIQPGTVFTTKTNKVVNPKYIINFPTKKHWRDKSKLEDIELGLINLVTEIKLHDIKSIAIPALGCGYGGLKKATVLPLIEAAFKEVPNVDALLYWY